MVRLSVLPAAAVTLFLFGVKASPCKPATTGVTSIAESSTVVPDSTATSFDSTAVTTVIEATSTVQEEPTADTTETSVVESVSTIASDTTTASAVVTTTALDPTTAAQEEPATTSGAPDCVETQLFINSGFDDSDSDITPWTSNGEITRIGPQSGGNAVAYAFATNGNDQAGTVSQTLSNLYGTYEFSYYYRVIHVSQHADYTCNTELKVGDTSRDGTFYDTVGDWRVDRLIFSDINVAQADVKLIVTCYGEYQSIQVNVDTLGFKRICSL